MLVTSTNDTGSGTQCENPNDEPSTPEDSGGGEFNWDSRTQGFILGGIALGNIFTVFLGGLLSEKFGGKLLFSVGILLSSCLSLLVPISAKTNTVLLIFVRALQGACQGPLIPAFHNMAHKWYPVQEKNFLMTITISGEKKIQC